MSSRISCDAVVIGAGHNGLVAANYLADAGLDVVIVDRYRAIGGMTRTDRPIADAPDHLINHCAVDPIFWSNGIPAKELGLEDYGLKWVPIDPVYAYLHPDGSSIAFWQDSERTVADIARFSARDAEAYRDLAQLMDTLLDLMLPMMSTNPVKPDPGAIGQLLRAAASHRKRMAEVGRFIIGSGAAEMHERFEHEVTRAALSAAAGQLIPASYPGSGMQILTLALTHRFGCLRPIGGTQAIPDALAARLTARGGQILTDARVAEIPVSAGRATGVVLEDGRQISAARAVVSAVDPRQTLTKLLPEDALEPRMRRRAEAIPGNDDGWGQLKVDIACRGQINLSHFERERTDGADLRLASHMMGTADELEAGYRRAAAGLLPKPEQIGFYNTIPTAADPSQAPPGQDTVYLFNITIPAHPDGGWTEELREQAVSDTVERAALFYGGLEELEIGRSSFTNQEMEAELGTDCSSHVTFVLNRTGRLRPAAGLANYRTPVAGLYLAGSGSHPGAAVTGLPGYLGARETLRDLRGPRFRRARAAS